MWVKATTLVALYHRPAMDEGLRDRRDRRADALAGESARVSKVVLGLPEEAFGQPTRCPPWDVKALLGHVWRDVDRILVYLAGPAPAAADATEVTYFRSYDPGADAPDISRRAQDVADEHGTGRALARSFDHRWREAVDAARREDPGRIVRTFRPSLLLPDYLATRVLEMAVHGLDLAHALGRERWITPEGTSIVRDILVGLLGIEPPASLEWDDVTFIETGTGRCVVSDDERAILGDRTALLPLLA
jgi:uncharacterized protein (TIGR03083 family)